MLFCSTGATATGTGGRFCACLDSAFWSVQAATTRVRTTKKLTPVRQRSRVMPTPTIAGSLASPMRSQPAARRQRAPRARDGAVQAFEVEVDDRSGVEREELGHDQASHDRHAER